MKRLLCAFLVLAIFLSMTAVAEMAEPIEEVEAGAAFSEEPSSSAEQDDEIVPEDIPQADLEEKGSSDESTGSVTFVMSVGKTSIAMGVKEQYTIPVSFTDGQEHACTFKTSNAKIAKVSADGVITAVKTGKALVRVTCDEGIIDIAVTVKKAPSKIKVSPSKQTCAVGETFKLTVTRTKGSAGSGCFYSSDESVAIVSGDGTVTALKPGTATITAKCYNGKKASAKVTVKPAPTSVTMAESLVLGEGQQSVLTAAYNDGACGAYTWSSSDPKVATVDSNGKVKALDTGSTVITFEAFNHVFAQCTVTVKNAPSKITLSYSSVTLYIGESIQVPVLVDPECEPGLKYTSSNKKYVSVSAGGVIKALKKGKATIKVTTYNGKKAYLKVTVKKGTPTMKLEDTSLKLGLGECRQLKVTGTAKMSFTSADPAVAEVDSNGKVTATGVGETVVTVHAANGSEASCTVSVGEAPCTVSLEDPAVMAPGQTCTPAYSMDGYGQCSFASSDTSVIKVNAESGEITAVNPGSAVYTVTAYNGVRADCTVTVLPAPESVSFSAHTMTVQAGETAALPDVSVYPENAYFEDTKTAVSVQGIIELNGDGTFTALHSGTCAVSMKAYNGVGDSVVVNVVEAATALTIQPSQLTLQEGESAVPAVKQNNGLECTSYYLVSSDESVVTIGSDGTSVIAAGAGEAEVAAVSDTGLTGTVNVEVIGYGEIFVMDAERLSLCKGETYQLNPQTTALSGEVITYETSNKKIATVSADGLVTAIGTGSCVITAVTANGCCGTCTVCVDGLILDISHYETILDFDALAKNVSFVILRATCGLAKDNQFDKNAAELNKRGVPFGVYCYGKATSESAARDEADYLYSTASKYKPKFYVYDAEASCLTADYIKAFTSRIRSKSGVTKVGCYCAHHMYNTYGMKNLVSLFDFIWIPRYGKNDGTVANSKLPAYECDLWQYTSQGTLSWIQGYVDMNRITGTGRSVSWFTE